HAQARNQLGNVYLKLGNRAAAREQYERALRLNPKAAGVHYNLGNLLALEGDRAGARRCFETALRLDPRFALAHNALGRLRAAEGAPAQAIAHFQQALAAQPNFADAHLNLAELLARSGDFNAARVHFESALKLQTNSARAHLGLAGLCLAQQQPTHAVEHLQRAIAAEPDHPEPLNNLAWLRATHPDAGLRNGAEAVQLATRAVELTRTNDAEILDTLAAAWAEAGDFERAVATADTALRLAQDRGLTNLLSDVTARRALYQSRQPYRQPERR
ncbi:MAG: tetratricopeptide repeat protein, partial [Verrucomicrobiales bacterium]|nr:tetratricopeptide repeat protein [Verrucomicrobiales bacterium]